MKVWVMFEHAPDHGKKGPDSYVRFCPSVNEALRVAEELRKTETWGNHYIRIDGPFIEAKEDASS